MSSIHPNYSTELHQNTTFYAELNGEHAGEGFMPLRSIVLEIWTRETKKITEFPIFFYKFSPNLLNGRIDEDRAHSKQSL